MADATLHRIFLSGSDGGGRAARQTAGRRFTSKKKKGLVSFIILLAILIALLISIALVNKPSQYANIDFGAVSTVENNPADNGRYYFIYESENCIYCLQMDDVYKKSIADSVNKKFWFVDLSNVPVKDPAIAGKNIKKIPAVVLYSKGKELARLEGKHSLAEVKQFLNTHGGAK